MLDTQYRMHPTIAEFPARHIYDNKLQSQVDPLKRVPPRGFPWPQRAHPVAFVETGASAAEGSSASSRSLRNPAQAGMAVEVVQGLLSSREVRAPRWRGRKRRPTVRSQRQTAASGVGWHRRSCTNRFLVRLALNGPEGGVYLEEADAT